MKAFGVVLLSLVVSNAHASWMSTKCSNSDGSVYWEAGSDKNEINLKYSNFVEGFLTLDVAQVSIKMSKVVTIQDKSYRSCFSAAKKRVFAGSVKIVASDKSPDILRSQFPENKVETDVICTTIMNNQVQCP
jgi:hypothetical protein